MLPPYLQHSRTFDLRSEYAKWQQHHPESLPFGPSSLANICAALEVEPVQSSAPIKHNLPFHLQALAPASPRRAMEEAITLARVLRGLIRKSQPPHEHPEILTKPMDARADVNAFLKERSKVLHMNGLPHDTTQSELESWFTQFGGRPIAFWTLRTPDQHKPTGSGFAVFSSHEEVSECLFPQHHMYPLSILTTVTTCHFSRRSRICIDQFNSGCRIALYERSSPQRKGHRGLALLQPGPRSCRRYPHPFPTLQESSSTR